MGRDKTLERILAGASDASVRFEDVCSLLARLGFQLRVRGSHHLFARDGVEELINLQRDGKNAKPYQVRQVRALITKYGLAPDTEKS
jgi:predicted RNA binding protein YcfA (HicA-like mRNA interferase family)